MTLAFEIEQNRDAIRVLFQVSNRFGRLIEGIRGRFGRPGPGEPPPPEPGGGEQGSAPIQRDEVPIPPPGPDDRATDGGDDVSPFTEGEDARPQ
jgi:hypothetical protein